MIQLDQPAGGGGSLGEFLHDASPTALDRQIKRLSSALNELLITRPGEEDDKGGAHIQFRSETDVNSKFEHMLFWPHRWEEVAGEAVPPRGLVVQLETDAAKADLKLYVSTEINRRNRSVLEVIVQPPEDRADYQCRRSVSYAEIAEREVKLSEIVAACAVSIAVRSRTDASDPRNVANRSAYRPPYSLYLAEPIPGGQDALLLGMVEYAKYIRTVIDPNTIAVIRQAGLQALSNAVRLFSGGDEWTPLRSYLFVHASVTMCEELGRSCRHDDAQKNEIIKQALKSPLFSLPGARQTKALAEEMMGEFEEAAKLWTQIAQEGQGSGAPDRVTALARQSDVRIRIARRLREAGNLWPALIMHSQVAAALAAQPNPPWNRSEQQKSKSLTAMLQNARLEVAHDKLRIAELAQTLASKARDQRAVVDFGMNGMRRIFTGVIVDGRQGATLAPNLPDDSISWAAGRLLPLRAQQTCVDQSATGAEVAADACLAVRQQIGEVLSGIVTRYRAEALSTLRELLVSAQGDPSPEAATPAAAMRQRDLAYKVYLVACQDQNLWSQDGARSDELVAQAAASTPDDGERKRLLVALSRCRLQALLRGTDWPDSAWLTQTPENLSKLAAVHSGVTRLLRQGEQEAQPVVSLLHYPAAWAAVEAYARWVRETAEKPLKDWIVKAAQRQDYEGWDDLMADMWKDFVRPVVAQEVVRTIGEVAALDQREARLTQNRSNVLELTEQTFLSWARTQPSLGAPRNSMFEAINRLETARAGLLKGGFEDLQDALEPLTRDLEKLQFPKAGTATSSSSEAFRDLDERIAGASALAFIRIYDTLAAGGKQNVPVSTIWLQQKRSLVDELVGKIEAQAIARWPADNPAIMAALEREWEQQQGRRLTAAELAKKREDAAQAAVKGALHSSGRIEHLAGIKPSDLSVRFHSYPSLEQIQHSDFSTLVSSTAAGARILEEETTCKRGMDGQTAGERLSWFLAHVGLHRERYLAAALPDGIRSETRSLARAYEAWCSRTPQVGDVVLMMARQRSGYFASPPGEARPRPSTPAMGLHATKRNRHAGHRRGKLL